MHKLLSILRPLLLLNVRRPFLVLFVAVVVGLLAGYSALQLRIDTDIANLLPADNPRVVALNQLRETVGGETEMDVAIGSPDFEANKRFAEDLIAKSLELYDARSQSPYFSKVEFRKDTEILKDYALFLATEDELDDLVDYLDTRIEDAKLEANPFFIDFDFDDEEDTTVVEDDAGNRFENVYKEMIPTEYPVNADSTVLTLKLFPTGSKSNLAFLRRMFSTYDSLVVAMNPASYHPDMQVKFGGRLKKHLLEIDSIMQDVYSSFSSGISSVLFLVMLYFFGKKYLNYRKGSEEDRKKSLLSFVIRAPVSVLVIGIPLFLSLIYTFGIAYLYLGTLNTMTSVLFVILFGLGIDYGIHFYARYLEKRSDGLDVEDAILATYESSGAAIFTSATTTAVALFVLIFADFRGFSEFGFIATTGIFLAWFAMSFILPAVVTVFERWNWVLVNRNLPEPYVVPVVKRYPFARTITLGGLTIMVLVIIFSGKLSFEYDFGKLEPEFPEYKEYQQFTKSQAPSSRRNPAYIIADNDAQVMEILDEIRTIKQANGEASTILDVEALQERFTNDEQVQAAKFERIAIIREQLNDVFIRDQEDENLDILRRASKVSRSIPLDSIPDFLKSRFMTRDGELGKFVMIYPSVGLSDGRNSIAFKNEIGLITTSDGKEFHSASTSIAAAEMLELMQGESPFFVSATFLMIVLLVLLSFRSLRWSVIAMLPLLVGLSWTFGIMILFDIKLNFYNLVVLPAILGIGNDNGVHLAARYLEEGPKSMWNVLKSTGQHITIGSLTTMLGFSGLMFTHHPGLFSIGLLATIGVGMTLLSALTFLPALIQVMEDRGWIHFISRHKSAD